jgi:3-hydroxyacyl-CoA dehydrogenase
MDAMIERGWLGVKTNQGFYKLFRTNGKKDFWPLNLVTLEHEPPQAVEFESMSKAKGIENLVDRIQFFLGAEDRAGDLIRASIYSGLAYASLCIPEIADNPLAIDDAMRWGFGYELGPFEMWDRLGVAETAEAMMSCGYAPAPWVKAMLATGAESFYKVRDAERVACYSPFQKGYLPIESRTKAINLDGLRKQGKILDENPGASLIDLGDGVACLEFHTKMNVIDDDIGRMAESAYELLSGDLTGLVIGNEADNFSAGANVMLIALLIQAGQWDDLASLIQKLQELHLALRYSPKPVVIAPTGLTLGGGAEMMMHGSRVVAAAELYTGLVEVGMGLIPAGGGTKEMMRRILNPAARTPDVVMLPFLQRVFEQIGQAKVATSAAEARQLGMLGPQDRVVMDRDRLLEEAKKEVLYMVETHYQPPIPEPIYAVGRDGLSALRVGIFSLKEGNYITEFESEIGEKLAGVLTGGDLGRTAWVDESYILELERESFLSLCGMEKTQERIWHFLQKGKPLRN